MDDMYSTESNNELGLPEMEEIERGVHLVPLKKKAVKSDKPATVTMML